MKKFNVASTVVIEFEGKQYRRVNRLARPGDVVIFRVNMTWEIYSTVNKPYRVEGYRHDGKPVFIGGTGREHLVYNHIHGRTTDTVEVYEPIQEEKSPNQLRKEIIDDNDATYKREVKINMDLKSINLEIAKEKACIDDLLEMIGMHTQDGRLDLAMARTIDLIRSIERIQKLENQRRFYITIHNLSKQGVLCEVVKRCESLNGAS